MSTWQIRDKNTGEIIHTTTNADFIACINTSRFEAIKTEINENAMPEKDQWDLEAEEFLPSREAGPIQAYITYYRPAVAAKLREMGAEIERRGQKIAEFQCQLDAWHKVFETSQFDHAAERLRVAEAETAVRDKQIIQLLGIIDKQGIEIEKLKAEKLAESKMVALLFRAVEAGNTKVCINGHPFHTLGCRCECKDCNEFAESYAAIRAAQDKERDG